MHQGNGFESSQLVLATTSSSLSTVLLQYSDLHSQSRLRFSSTLTGQHFQTLPIVSAEATQVPSWYEQNRVQLHSRNGAVPNPNIQIFMAPMNGRLQLKEHDRLAQTY
ncbi:hypothetical protein N9N28_13585 [Rubripirellula amarantea]|nr:hypothetical protein [Rubripirellula amarantea]